jgi:hypothetical protein
MISDDIWRDPAFANDIAVFRNNVRRYWKANVKKYFSKREAEYGLQPKLNHRFMISQYNEGREPRIQNALVVNWTRYNQCGTYHGESHENTWVRRDTNRY